MDCKTFNDLVFEPHLMLGVGGKRAYLEFPNGYGISVVTGEFAYCDDTHPYEIAVMKDGECCYSTMIADDIIGYLTEDGVTEVMKKIQEL